MPKNDVAIEMMVFEAIGDGRDWPKMTTNPEVNCEVDHRICGTPRWDFLTEDQRELYRNEAMLAARTRKDTSDE